MLSDRAAFPILLIVGSVLLLSGSDAVIKAVSAQYSLWQIYTLRSAFAVPALLAMLAAGGGLHHVGAILRSWVMLRTLLLAGAWMTYYVALPWIGLSVAAAAFYTAPLFMACLSPLLMKEAVGPARWVGIIVGFLGVLIILRPGTADFSPLTLLPVAAAVSYATMALITRTRCASESPLVLGLAIHLALLAIGLIGTLTVAVTHPSPFSSFLLGGWTAVGGRDIAIMAALGIVQAIAAAGVARAYQAGAPAVIGTFDYGYLVFAAAWGAIFFNETPGLSTTLGMILIILAGLVVLGPRNLLRPSALHRNP